MKRSVLALASLLACAATDPAQIPKGTGEITGIVLDAVTKRPVVDATVTLRLVGQVVAGSGLSGREVFDEVPPAYRTQRFYTRANGLFRLKPPIAGHYNLAVSKPGYPTGYFGQQKPRDDMQFFDIAQDEVMSGVTLLLWPGASISGVVRSKAGVPLPGKWAELFEVRNYRGARSLEPVIQEAQVTDKAGAYRFSGLTNGRYLVRVSTIELSPIITLMEMPRNSSGLSMNSLGPRPDASNTTYRSGSLPDSRDVIDVAIGQQTTGVDFALPDGPFPTHEVAGRIEGTKFSPAGQKVRLVLANAPTDLPPYLEVASGTMAPDGTFVLPRIPAGSYRIRSLMWPGFDSARHNPPGIGPPEQQIPWDQGRSAWVDHELTVRNADVNDLVLGATIGARVLGRITLSSELQNLRSSDVWIEARSLDGWNLQNLPLGWVEPDGTFASAALPPGRYSILPKATGNQWFPESAVLQATDTIASGLQVGTDDVSGLVVALTRLKARVSGKVTDATGTPRGDAHVLFFRKGGSWETGNVSMVGAEVGFGRTSRTGQYELSVNAGDYFTVAVVGDFPEAWWNPAFLKSLIPQATTVSLQRGASVVESLVAHVVK